MLECTVFVPGKGAKTEQTHFRLVAFCRNALYFSILIFFSEHFPKQALDFTCLQYMSFENTVGKEKLPLTRNFSFSHSACYTF